MALKRSLENQKPVRVLRSSTGQSKWAPFKGLRYDGLYQVVRSTEPKNDKGGKYEQFVLERVEGQADINRLRPSAAEIRDFDKIERGWK